MVFVPGKLSGVSRNGPQGAMGTFRAVILLVRIHELFCYSEPLQTKVSAITGPELR